MNFDFDNFDFDFSFNEEIKVLDPKIERVIALLSNFPYGFKDFCAEFGKIKPKEGGLKAFVFNESQNKWFDFLIKNYEKYNKHKISFLTIKFRQNGISTISSAFGVYGALANNYNVAFTGKDQMNITNLFNMVERFYNNSDLKQYGFVERKRHQNKHLNINDIYFYFGVATGSGTRGLTTGGLIPDELGERTDEMDIEALADVKNNFYLPLGTPKGIDTLLYTAYKGMPEDDILFLAWHEMEENSLKDVDKILPEIENYLTQFELQKLPIDKKAWIQEKYIRIRARAFQPENVLNQEYPPNVKVGFEATAEDCFCNVYFINRAFDNRPILKSSNVIVGIDVSRNGKESDACVMCIRYGDYAEFIELKASLTDYSADYTRCLQVINFFRNNINLRIKAINIDIGGNTEFTRTLQGICKTHSIRLPIHGINFGSPKIERVGYDDYKSSMRDYMYKQLELWLVSDKVKIENVVKSVSGFSEEIIKKDLLATKITFRNGSVKIIDKEDIRKNLKRSPDYADALALTFAGSDISIKAQIY